MSVDPYLKMYYGAHRLNNLIFIHALTHYKKLHTVGRRGHFVISQEKKAQV